MEPSALDVGQGISAAHRKKVKFHVQYQDSTHLVEQRNAMTAQEAMPVQTVGPFLSLVHWEVMQTIRTFRAAFNANLVLNVQQQLVVVRHAQQVWGYFRFTVVRNIHCNRPVNKEQLLEQLLPSNSLLMYSN